MRGLAALLLLAAGMASATPSFEEVRAGYRGSDGVLRDRHGELVHEKRVDAAGRRLDWVGLADVSPALRDAVVRAEDKRFYRHGGVDWLALSWASVRNLIGRGRKTRGASTLTMQLAALVTPGLRARGGRRDFFQKWKQVQEAYALERRWSKDRILEAYLNLVTFRGELRGVAAASRGLFGKDPHGLNAAESAVLAALLRSPNARRDDVARRACLIAAARGPECEAIGRMVGEVLSRPYQIAARTALAPHVAGRLLRDGATSAVSSLDASLQRFALEILQAHLTPLKDRNVADGAVLVVENATGEVLAYVGNAGVLASEAHVDGIQARRQAGSTLKPFVYGVALERKLVTAASLLDDSSLEVPVPRGVYRPMNYDNRFHGLVTLRNSLGSSLNVPAVRTLLLAGVGPVVERLGALGFGDLRPADYYGPSLALGSLDVTLWELVNAYRALANGGRASPLSLVPVREPPHGKPALEAATAYVVADILSDRESRSLTFGLENPLSTRFWTAVKTGTSKDMRDNWCVGFSERYTVGVWTGNFSGEPMWNVSGVSGAAPVWTAIMNRLHAETPSRPPRRPPGVTRARVTLAPLGITRDELFLDGTAPGLVEVDPARRTARILYPTSGLVIALDPDIPPGNEEILLEADPGGVARRWELDGRDLGALAPGRKAELPWVPAPGRHRLALKDGTGIVQDTVSFEVRGARAAVD